MVAPREGAPVFERGYLQLGSEWGTALRLHWMFVVVPFLLGGTLRSAQWAALVVLIGLHELGHAAAVRRCRGQVIRIDVHGFGGSCASAGDLTEGQTAFIAWGGVLAQAAVFVV